MLGAGGSLGTICKSCTTEPQAEPGKGGEVSNILLIPAAVFTSTRRGPPVCNTCSSLEEEKG